MNDGRLFTKKKSIADSNSHRRRLHTSPCLISRGAFEKHYLSHGVNYTFFNCMKPMWHVLKQRRNY